MLSPIRTVIRCVGAVIPAGLRLLMNGFISMGEVYDKPRESLTAEEKKHLAAFQIMEVSIRSSGSPISVTSARWTGCATCTTG